MLNIKMSKVFISIKEAKGKWASERCSQYNAERRFKFNAAQFAYSQGGRRGTALPATWNVITINFSSANQEILKLFEMLNTMLKTNFGRWRLQQY